MYVSPSSKTFRDTTSYLQMKTIHLTYLILLLSFTAFAQNWKPYKIDDSVQVSLPPGFERKDTLGQTMITGSTSFGNILITISPDNTKSTPDIEKEKQLETYYDNFVSKIKSSSKNGSISNERDTLVGKLKVKDVKLSVDSGSGKQHRNIRILHVNNATYTFQFLYQDIHTEYAIPESTTFFNSMRIPPDADLETQFTNPQNTTGQSPANKDNSLYIYGGIGLLILIALIFLIRRSRRH